MEKKITNIKERILYIAELKRISKEKFFSDFGMTYGNFKGKAKEAALNSKAIEKILTIHDDINANWLLLGKGEIFIDKAINDDDYKQPKHNSLQHLEEAKENYGHKRNNDLFIQYEQIMEERLCDKDKLIASLGREIKLLEEMNLYLKSKTNNENGKEDQT